MSIGIVIDRKTETTHDYKHNGIEGMKIDKTISTFYPDLGTTKNAVAVGKVQSGKTQYIINLITKTLNDNKIPILIASDRLSVLDQYKTRFKDKITNMLINIDSSIDVKKENFKNETVYISILSIERLTKIKELIYHGGINYRKEFVLIIDEGDLSIKDIACRLEKLQRKMDKCNVFLKRIFITATPFSVTNSIAISENIEEYIVISPERKGFIYRDYLNMKIKYTNKIKRISSLNDPDENDIKNFVEFLDNSMGDRLSKTQPNIGLLKIFHNNNDKHEFAKKLNRYIKNLNIIVYTGKGSVLYFNKEEKYMEKQGSCIAQTIQKLKDEDNKYPILIISYNMASRSQTFKSVDHKWMLTHFFIDLPNTSSVEQTIQALRCNGQYKNTDPLVNIYVSKETDDRIKKLLYNNNLLIKTCDSSHKNNKNVNMRESISDINFVKVPNFRMSNRKGVDDTKIIQSIGDGLCKNYEDAKKMAKILANKNDCLSKPVNVTKKHFVITCKEIVKRIKKNKNYNRHDKENIYTQLKNNFDNEKSFNELNCKQQNLLRKIILEKSKQEYPNLQIKRCQIGYYSERTKILNNINHLKHKQFQAEIISEIMINGDINAVIYRKNYYTNPENFNNRVLIWRDTNNSYHLCVNKENPSYSFVTLTHE